jgi:NADH-quinone oxidoreductase subunit G
MQVLKDSPLPIPNMRDIEDHDAVFVLGEDLTQTAARMALSLRQSVKGKAEDMADAMRVQPWLDAAVKNIGQHALNPLFIASLAETKLDDIAEECVHAAPDDLARIGFAVAHALDASAPAVEGLDAEALELAKRIADALLAAKRPLIIAGTSLGSEALIEAAANIAKALKLREKNGSISLIVPEANSLGLAMLGGESVDAALQAVIDGKADAIVVLENDLYTRTDKAKVDAALNAAKVLIVADHQKTATSDRAHLVLPAASFAEGDGTLVSQEGRAQRFFQVFDPKYMDASILVHEGWRWLHALRATLLNQPIDWTQLDHVTAAVASSTRAEPHRRCRTVRRVPHQGHETGPRAAALLRSYRHARRHQRARTAYPAGQGHRVRLLDGRLLGLGRTASASAIRLVSGLELAASLEQVPGRSRWSHPCWRPGHPPDRKHR